MGVSDINNLAVYDVINDIRTTNARAADRLGDYVRNKQGVLLNIDLLIRSWMYTTEGIAEVQSNLKKVVNMLLSLTKEEIIWKLEENQPEQRGSLANYFSIEKAFL